MCVRGGCGSARVNTLGARRLWTGNGFFPHKDAHVVAFENKWSEAGLN